MVIDKVAFNEVSQCSMCGTAHEINDTVWKSDDKYFCDYCANMPGEELELALRLVEI